MINILIYSYLSQDPVPIVEKWAETFNATEEKSFCMQKNYLIPNPTVAGVEDCLYLYVYRPKVSRTQKFNSQLNSVNESESDQKYLANRTLKIRKPFLRLRSRTCCEIFFSAWLNASFVVQRLRKF